ncbi:MAG: HD domain-containing protein [Actinobacteria bacterium]|nr:HD domain-containing protein [Actinomycetota bacterium]
MDTMRGTVELEPPGVSLVIDSVPVSSIAAGVVVQDHQGRIVGFNQAALDLLGLTGSEITGLTSLDPRWRAVRPDGTPFQGEFHPAQVTLRTGKELDGVVMGVRKANGSLVWMTVASRRLGPVPTHSVVVTFVEITAQQATQKALELSRAIDRVLVRSSTEQELLGQMCLAAAADTIGSLAWVAIGEDDDARTISVRAAAGATDYLDGLELSWSVDDERGRGPAGTAIREREFVVIEDLETDVRFAPWRARAHSFGFECVLAVPFRIGDRDAAFIVYYPTALMLDGESMRVLSGLSADLEYGINNLRRAQSIVESLESTVRALAAVSELRDPYTFGHQQRVARLAASIARTLDLDDESVETVRLGGMLHDIGKMAVPAELLAKPGPLDRVEFELVKRHCLVGAHILRQSQLQSPVPEIAAQHHERLDGSGYPLGLSGGEIHLFARIVAVADVYEAIVHHRPYRPALGSAAALRILADAAGTKFDPRVVQACQQTMNQGFDFNDD